MDKGNKTKHHSRAQLSESTRVILHNKEKERPVSPTAFRLNISNNLSSNSWRNSRMLCLLNGKVGYL